MMNDQKTTIQIVITARKEKNKCPSDYSVEKLCGILKYIDIILRMQKVLCMESSKIEPFFQSFLENEEFTIPNGTKIIEMMNAVVENVDNQYANNYNQYANNMLKSLTDPKATMLLSFTFSIDF